MLVSQGFTILRFAKDAWVEGGRGVVSRQISMDWFYCISPFCLCVCACARAGNFSLIHEPGTSCRPSLTFPLTSASKHLSGHLLAPSPPLSTRPPKPPCAFIPLCLRDAITCAAWPGSPIRACKICNIFRDGSLPILGTLFFYLSTVLKLCADVGHSGAARGCTQR